MNKTIRSIQFIPGRVVVDYGENKVFQFCKSCHNGGHMKAFLNHFCPQVNLQLLDQKEACLLERRFYFLLTQGPTRRIVNREGYVFGEYVHKRSQIREQQRLRKKRKEERKLQG